jgi:hypothetical protein
MYEVRWGEGETERTKPFKELAEAADYKKKMEVWWPERSFKICMVQVETIKPLEQLPLL